MRAHGVGIFVRVESVLIHIISIVAGPKPDRLILFELFV